MRCHRTYLKTRRSRLSQRPQWTPCEAAHAFLRFPRTYRAATNTTLAGEVTRRGKNGARYGCSLTRVIDIAPFVFIQTRLEHISKRGKQSRGSGQDWYRDVHHEVDL